MTTEQLKIEGGRAPSPEAPNKGSDAWIGDLVGTFCDPIIVMPGGWGDSLPDWIKGAITLERLIENMKSLKGDDGPTGTDAEACAYLYTASLTAPISSDWTQIYLYVAGKVIKRRNKTEMPQDIVVESLTRNQLDDLRRLKRWIYERRVKARQERDRDERREQREANAQQEADLRPALFEL